MTQTKFQPDANADNADWLLWWENRQNQKKFVSVTAFFTIVGKTNCTGDIELQFDLVPATSGGWKLQFDPKSIGAIDKVRVKLADTASSQTKWEIAKLFLLHSKTGQVHEFTFKKPIIKKPGLDSTMEASKSGAPVKCYQIELHLGDRHLLLSNDIRAKLIVRGSKGDTGPRCFVNALEAGPLKAKPGDIFSFDVDSVDIGAIQGIVFTHNKPGKSASHFVQKVVVTAKGQSKEKGQKRALDFGKKPEGHSIHKSNVLVEQKRPDKTADPGKWIMSFTNLDSQPVDKAQISVVFVGTNVRGSRILFSFILSSWFFIILIGKIFALYFKGETWSR